MAQHVGTVIWFNNAKGYGFVKAEGQHDVFCHYTAIHGEKKYRSLTQGDAVEFDIEAGTQGLQAANVRKLETSLNLV